MAGVGSLPLCGREVWRQRRGAFTVSKEQAELARANCRGLPIEIRLIDYRELNQQFDHIYSIGMFEHVGPKKLSYLS